MQAVKFLLDLGVKHSNNTIERLQLKFINIVALLGIIINVMIIGINFMEGLIIQIAINSFLITAIFLPVLVLNHLGKLSFSKLIIYYPVITMVFLAAILNPGESREFNMIGYTIVGLFIYNHRNSIIAFLYSLTLFFILHFMQKLNISYPDIRDLTTSTISYASIFTAEYFAITFYKKNSLDANRKLEIRHEELKNSYTTIKRHTTEIEQSNDWLIRLFSILSHDLKSPINSIKASLSLYADNKLSHDEWQVLVPMLNEKISKTDDLVNTLLMWTKIQLNGINLKKSPFNLKKSLDELKDSLVVELNLKVLDLKIKCDLEGQLIYTDKTILYIIVRNLLTNAIKFSYQGGKIELHCYAEARNLLIEIKDYGLGMNEEVKQSLFTNNQIRGMGTQNESGNGLGLVICKELLGKLEGNFLVHSKEKKGTTISIHLNNVIRPVTANAESVIL